MLTLVMKSRGFADDIRINDDDDGLQSSFNYATGVAKGSAICAIGMVKLPFVINLKFSRAVECKNILKLPRPTLLKKQCRWFAKIVYIDALN